jgi:outer membrane protein insertion porin family
MLKNRTIQSLLLLSCLLSPLNAAELYDEKRVARVEIVLDSSDRNATIDTKAILIQMKTQSGTEFNQVVFDKDLKTLSEQYEVVDAPISLKQGELYITVHVKKKPQIHNIEFVGNESVSTTKLQDELEVKTGTVYDRAEFVKSFNKIKQYYFKHGYFNAQINYNTIPVPGTDQVDIQISIVEGHPGLIKRIELEGFTKGEKGDIEEQMYLKKYNFLYSWLTGTGIYSDEAMEQDRMTITTYMHDHGFADAKIGIELRDDPSSGKLIVKISCDRGAEYHIGTVQLEGNTLIPTDELMAKLEVKPGEIYSPKKIQEGAQAIKDFYGHKGYIDASVNYETPLHEDEPIFDVQYTVDEGQQYKIGLIHIFGNTSTKNNVILRESLLVPGETFDSRKLKATQQRLEAVGYFKSVNVYAVRTEDDAGMGENYRDVYIEVEETSTGNISLFAGFSSSDSLTGGLDLTERNFDISGVGKALIGNMSALRGGGEYLHIRGTAGTKQYNVLVSWLNPYVNDTLWRLGVEVTSTFSELQSEDAKTTTSGGSVYTSYPITNYWTVGARQRVREVVDKLNLAAEDGSIIAHESIDAVKHEFQQDGVISAFSANIGYDSVDNTFKPHRGWRTYLEPEFAGVGGRFHFWKFSYTNTLYVPIWKKGTLKLRGDFKFILPFARTHDTNTPYSERFFLGGDATMRGYKPWGFGSRIHLLNDKGKSVPTDTPKGGLSMAYFSVEYNQEIIRMIDIFGFCDIGSLSPVAMTVHKFRASAGVGLRIDIGNRTPIMVGWGYVFNEKDREHKSQPVFFSMGGAF